MPKMSHGELIQLMIQLGVMLAFGRVMAEAARKFNQPAVVGEILAGIILGPTILGTFSIHTFQMLFPQEGTSMVVLDGFTKVAVVMLLFIAHLSIAQYKPSSENLKNREWFQEARFGLFIHWGVYSVLGDGEWAMNNQQIPIAAYEKVPSFFNPTEFNPAEWVQMVKDAGMKYITITSKHHDGFGMFRSDMTDWCISRTPFQRDPLAELAAACKAEGVTFCFYHSIMDWHHPDWGIRRSWNDVAAASGPPDGSRRSLAWRGTRPGRPWSPAPDWNHRPFPSPRSPAS